MFINFNLFETSMKSNFVWLDKINKFLSSINPISLITSENFYWNLIAGVVIFDKSRDITSPLVPHKNPQLLSFIIAISIVLIEYYKLEIGIEEKIKLGLLFYYDSEHSNNMMMIIIIVYILRKAF